MLLLLSDGLRARRYPIVNVALIEANFAVWMPYELAHLDAAGYHATFNPARSTTPASPSGRGSSRSAIVSPLA
jgi:hypothetical protein